MATAPFDPDGFFEHVDAGAGGGANDHAAEHPLAPHDLAAEAAVLSASLLSNEHAARAVSLLRPEDFYAEAHRRMFEAVTELSAAGKPVDVVQVATWLREHDRLSQVGGMAYITEVLNAAPAVAHVDAYAETVARRSRARAVILAADRVSAEVRAGGDPESSIAKALGAFEAVRPRSPVTIIHAAAIAEPLSPLASLVRELGLVAGGGGPHLVAGFGFSGKTVALQSLALSLSAGRAVWGTYRTDERRVTHVDLEQGDRLTRARYQRLAIGMGIDLASLDDRLALAVMPPIKLAAEHAPAWRALMLERDLLIVDSLSAASAGVDENDARVRAGLDLLGSISEQTGCRALVIHHARKPSKDEPGAGRYAVRGSSAIFDAVDSAYMFSAEKGEPVRVEHVKARSFGEPAEDFALVISDVERDGNPKAGLRVDLRGAELLSEKREERAAAGRSARVRDDARVVLDAVLRTPGVGTRELRGITRLSGDRIAAAMAELDGRVEVREVANPKGPPTKRHHVRGAA